MTNVSAREGPLQYVEESEPTTPFMQSMAKCSKSAVNRAHVVNQNAQQLRHYDAADRLRAKLAARKAPAAKPIR